MKIINVKIWNTLQKYTAEQSTRIEYRSHYLEKLKSLVDLVENVFKTHQLTLWNTFLVDFAQTLNPKRKNIRQFS